MIEIEKIDPETAVFVPNGISPLPSPSGRDVRAELGIGAGDPVVVEHRPDHEVTIGLIFRALTTEPDLLPLLLEADDLPEEAKDRARRRLTFHVLP